MPVYELKVSLEHMATMRSACLQMASKMAECAAKLESLGSEEKMVTDARRMAMEYQSAYNTLCTAKAVY